MKKCVKSKNPRIDVCWALGLDGTVGNKKMDAAATNENTLNVDSAVAHT